MRSEEISFFRNGLPKKFPEFPEFSDASVLALFGQTGAPERHPPGRPAPQSRPCCGKLGELGKLFSCSRGGIDLNLPRNGTVQPTRYLVGRGGVCRELPRARFIVLARTVPVLLGLAQDGPNVRKYEIRKRMLTPDLQRNRLSFCLFNQASDGALTWSPMQKTRRS